MQKGRRKERRYGKEKKRRKSEFTSFLVGQLTVDPDFEFKWSLFVDPLDRHDELLQGEPSSKVLKNYNENQKIYEENYFSKE